MTHSPEPERKTNRPDLEGYKAQCAEVPLEKQCWYVPTLVETIDYTLGVEPEVVRLTRVLHENQMHPDYDYANTGFRSLQDLRDQGYERNEAKNAHTGRVSFYMKRKDQK